MSDVEYQITATCEDCGQSYSSDGDEDAVQEVVDWGKYHECEAGDAIAS